MPQTELANAPASYSSPDFTDASGDLTASNTVSYRATAAEENRSFELMTSPKTPGCLSTIFGNIIEDHLKHPTSSDDTLPEGATVGKPTVSPLSFPHFGDKSSAYRVKVPFTFHSLDFSAIMDEVFVIKGRASVDMSFQSIETPFPIDKQEHYTGLVINRLTNTR